MYIDDTIYDIYDICTLLVFLYFPLQSAQYCHRAMSVSLDKE